MEQRAHFLGGRSKAKAGISVFYRHYVKVTVSEEQKKYIGVLSATFKSWVDFGQPFV